MNFIIWGYEDGPIRVEEKNVISKNYTHRCEPAKGGRGNLGSQTKGLRTALAKPISVRKPKVCELRWRSQSRFANQRFANCVGFRQRSFKNQKTSWRRHTNNRLETLTRKFSSNFPSFFYNKNRSVMIYEKP